MSIRTAANENDLDDETDELTDEEQDDNVGDDWNKQETNDVSVDQQVNYIFRFL